VTVSELRDQDLNGIVYHSVRYPDDQVVALFWSIVARIPKPGQHFLYH